MTRSIRPLRTGLVLFAIGCTEGRSNDGPLAQIADSIGARRHPVTCEQRPEYPGIGVGPYELCRSIRSDTAWLIVTNSAGQVIEVAKAFTGDRTEIDMAQRLTSEYFERGNGAGLTVCVDPSSDAAIQWSRRAYYITLTRTPSARELETTFTLGSPKPQSRC